MAAAIKQARDIDSNLSTGRTGSFEVSLDGELIFSKLDTGRFPTEEEILLKID